MGKGSDGGNDREEQLYKRRSRREGRKRISNRRKASAALWLTGRLGIDGLWHRRTPAHSGGTHIVQTTVNCNLFLNQSHRWPRSKTAASWVRHFCIYTADKLWRRKAIECWYALLMNKIVFLPGNSRALDRPHGSLCMWKPYLSPSVTRLSELVLSAVVIHLHVAVRIAEHCS